MTWYHTPVRNFDRIRVHARHVVHGNPVTEVLAPDVPHAAVLAVVTLRAPHEFHRTGRSRHVVDELKGIELKCLADLGGAIAQVKVKIGLEVGDGVVRSQFANEQRVGPGIALFVELRAVAVKRWRALIEVHLGADRLSAAGAWPGAEFPIGVLLDVGVHGLRPGCRTHKQGKGEQGELHIVHGWRDTPDGLPESKPV